MILPYNPTIALIDTYVGIYKIYILKNPFTDEIFYVGQTRMELITRLNGHLSETGANREKINYIKDIVVKGSKPIIEAIEVIPTKCYIDTIMVNHRELYWIKFYIESGCNLLNKAGIDTNGSHYEYRRYLANIKRGETQLHYYVCGKTRGGYEVYDEQKLKSDGFELKIEEPEVQIKKEPTDDDLKFQLKSLCIKLNLPYPKKEEEIKTVTFPEQPKWSAGFASSIPYTDDDPADWEFEYDFNEDDEPDCDDEPEYDSDSSDEEYDWYPAYYEDQTNPLNPFEIGDINEFIKTGWCEKMNYINDESPDYIRGSIES